MKFLKIDEYTYLNIDKIILIERYLYNYNTGKETLNYTIIHFENNNDLGKRYSSVIIKKNIDEVVQLIRDILNRP